LKQRNFLKSVAEKQPSGWSGDFAGRSIRERDTLTLYERNENMKNLLSKFERLVLLLLKRQIP
jgi:hypothetical protein